MTGKGEDTEENHANVIHAIPVTLLLGGCYFIGALVVLTFLFVFYCPYAPAHS